MLSTVSDPSCNAPSEIPLLIPFILFRDVDFSLWPSGFRKQASPLWWPTPCAQQYGFLHQLPFLWSVVSFLLVSCPTRFLLRVLIYPCSWMMVFLIVAVVESLLAMWLAYYVNWVIRFILAPVMLVTAALSSTVACSRFDKSSSIPTRLLVSYPPWREVCCRSQRYYRTSMKWAWKAVQYLFSHVLHAQKSSG